MSLADRLRDLLGKDDEADQPEPREEPDDDGQDEDDDDPSVYPLW